VGIEPTNKGFADPLADRSISLMSKELLLEESTLRTILGPQSRIDVRRLSALRMPPEAELTVRRHTVSVDGEAVVTSAFRPGHLGRTDLGAGSLSELTVVGVKP